MRRVPQRRPATGVPPPPGPITERADWSPESRHDSRSYDTPERPAPSGRARSRPAGARFDAEMELTELDDRERPGPTWAGQGRELSRSHLVVRSRRMCYPGRTLLIAVHLIDDRPVPLMGKVYACDYDGDGQYKIAMDLMTIPERPEIRDWILSRG